MIPRYFIVAARDHEIQNPTSEEKLRLLGERLRLDSGSRVLDVASGRGGPALLLAREFGCRAEGIEVAPEFQAVAVERAEAAGLAHLVSSRLGDASQEELPAEAYDVALCLGATFVWGGLAATLDALEPVVRAGGHVVVGEPFWRKLPLPEDYADRDGPYTTLEGTVAILESGGLSVGRRGRRQLAGAGGPAVLHGDACGAARGHASPPLPRTGQDAHRDQRRGARRLAGRRGELPRRLPARGARARPRRAHARHRRDHPGRPVRAHRPRAGAAARHPGRARDGEDRRRPAPRFVSALRAPSGAPPRARRGTEPGLHGLRIARPPGARRGRRRPARGRRAR